MASYLKLNCGRLAVLAAMGLFAGAASPAIAADLGGNCCADLEERIAELEATTARKGNRKVKLEVSGHVNETLLFWDDGSERNAGIYTNDNARTRFRFKGEGRINEEWKAGYLLEIGVRSANSKRFNQNEDNAVLPTDVGLDIRHSVWYIDSKTYGRLWVGLTGGAGESVTEVNLAATKDVAKYSDVEDSGLGLIIRRNGVLEPGNFEWRRLLRDGGDQPGEGRRSNMVRYDTPEFKGFTGTVNWGEDDGWEAGLRYKGEIGTDFLKIAAAVAYGESKDGGAGAQPFQCVGNQALGSDRDCSQLGGSISIMHHSGVYANFAAGMLEDDLIGLDSGVSVPVAFREDTSYFYAGEVGYEAKFSELGKTTFYFQYFKNEGGTQDRAAFGQGDIAESELESFGAGIVQGIDAAAMHMYVTYRHYEGEITQRPGGVLTTTDLDDLDVVMGGAIIRF